MVKLEVQGLWLSFGCSIFVACPASKSNINTFNTFLGDYKANKYSKYQVVGTIALGQD